MPTKGQEAVFIASAMTFHRALGEVLRPILAEDGVTNGQFLILSLISRMTRPSMGKIASEFGVRMPAVTQLINDLEARKLVRRERSSKDRRVVRIAVTARGSRLLTHIEGLTLELVRDASSGIAARRMADASALLNEVAFGLRTGPRSARPSRRPRSRSSPSRGVPK